ncbi:class I SAM-dependent methyltransferase [Lachnospiraceae bacterium 54-11]
MLRLEYIDTIRYEAGSPKAMFLLADREYMEEKNIVIFGTGTEAFFAFHFLKQKGLEANCFLNNDSRLQGSFFCGKEIRMPNEIWGKNFFFIIAMSNIKYQNEVLWQLRVNKESQYGIAFIETFHAFTDGKMLSELHELVLENVNKLLCEGREIGELIKPVVNVGPAGNVMFPIMELCWTTTWSHHLLQWFYNEYSQNSKDKKSMLEIGPGRGLFSLVVNSINPRIDIEWLMFEMDEKSVEAVQGRYEWWPANRFKSYYGMIEEPKYRINKKFDIIVMTEVLEHFSANPRVGMRKIADMLKDNGKIYLSTPAWGHLPIYDTYYDIPDFTNVEEYKESYIGHSYQYSRSELEQLLTECGLKIDRYALTDGKNHNLVVSHR